MAIRPRYADAILDGHKKAEFRKRRLAADVTTVVIYATAPVKRIIGEFSVNEIVLAPPDELWATLHPIGGVHRTAFDAYYADVDSAAAILVRCAQRYAAPVRLADLDPAPAVPQSFSYVDQHILEQLRGVQTHRRDLLDRLANSMSNHVERSLQLRSLSHRATLPSAVV